MEKIDLAHMPAEMAVYAMYFAHVENASFLREQLLASNAEFEYAFIDASMVLSRKQVLAATWRAMNDYLNNRLKSRNIHSEIVFSLSPNNNIGEAFRRFGISESTRSLVVIKVATESSTTLGSVSNHLTASIKGLQTELSDEQLQEGADVARIRKVYKLNSPASKKQPNGVSHEQELHDIEVQILGLMALRGAA